MIFLVLLLVLLKVIHWLMAHETIFELTKRRQQSIKENGLIHYTTIEKAKTIICDQKLIGSFDTKSTFPSHRNDRIIWFFGCTNTITEKFFRWCILRRHSPKIHCGKKGTIKYETKLLVQNISDEQISKMKINIELGIGCYMEEMDNILITYASLDKIDKLLGVRNKW